MKSSAWLKRKAHGGEEAEKTLTEFLVQLDGGNNNDGVLFIGQQIEKICWMKHFFAQAGLIFLFKYHCPIRLVEGKSLIFIQGASWLADEVFITR